MKNFNVKQSGSEVILEEVNPWDINYVSSLGSVKSAYQDFEDNRSSELIICRQPYPEIGSIINEFEFEIIYQLRVSSAWKVVSQNQYESAKKINFFPTRKVATFKKATLTCNYCNSETINGDTICDDCFSIETSFDSEEVDNNERP